MTIIAMGIRLVGLLYMVPASHFLVLGSFFVLTKALGDGSLVRWI